ncbi:MAG: rhomboid family intramembrane serine protease [Lewinellaceae bacterium]|nr:rhomboid family intramembrane serine protease [Lewinellaceae bacterium]
MSDITEIDRVEKARYYQIDNVCVETDTGGSFANMRVSGKRRQYLNIDLYFVKPIIQRGRKVSMDTPPEHWYGVKFHEQINNKLDVTEKEKAYEAFYADCVQKMERYPFRTVAYFERIPNSEDRQHYLHAVQRCIFQSADTGHIILIPVLDTFEDRNGNSFGWIFGSSESGWRCSCWHLSGRDTVKKKESFVGEKPKQDDLKETLQYLIPRGDHLLPRCWWTSTCWFYSWSFRAFILFIPTQRSCCPGSQQKTGNNRGEWWRLLTSMFVHSALLHLIMNLVRLGLAGIFLEPVLRRKNYLYPVHPSGICGSLTSIWWHPRQRALALGAICAFRRIAGTAAFLPTPSAAVIKGYLYLSAYM